MIKFLLNLVALVLIFYLPANSQNQKEKANKIKFNNTDCFRIFFYNTENFFDTIDDPKTEDNEFLPGSKRHWTQKRYYNKLNNIYRVFISAGIQPPSLIGLCEIENNNILNDLTQKTPLLKFNYRYLHHDSPDPRGIDVALLYRPDQFKPLQTQYIKIIFPFDTARKTREILYVKGIAFKSDTLHVFVNHWPSRARGQVESIPYREQTARILRHKVDSLSRLNAKNKIIIIGDFNDEPDDLSVSNDLGALKISNTVKESALYNLSAGWLKNVQNIGTIKFKGKWQIFDQIIVSGTLIKSSTKGLICGINAAKIYVADFLLKDDRVYSGKTLFKTYTGFLMFVMLTFPVIEAFPADVDDLILISKLLCSVLISPAELLIL